MIPGSNMLGQALTLIARQTVIFLPTPPPPYAIGPTGLYAEPTRVPETVPGCSVQPVNRARYNDLGLDFTREYVEVWIPRPVRGVERGRPPDRMQWAGKVYQVEAVTEWHAVDGWSRVLFVSIGAVPADRPGEQS